MMKITWQNNSCNEATLKEVTITHEERWLLASEKHNINSFVLL